MFENFVKNMDEKELKDILKDSGITFVGPEIIELEESESYGTKRYKKNISMQTYIEKLIDKRKEDKAMKKLEERFKTKLLKMTSKIKN